MTTGSLSALWDFHGEVLREHAHQLLVWAHADARSELVPELDEPGMTGKLVEAMKHRLNSDVDLPEEYLHYWPGDQEPISPDGQTGNDRLRLDITLVRTGIRPRISYIIEAKRLRTNGFPIGKYIGAGGMGDFIECRYGRECPEAAMVALFEDRDIVHWHSELRRVFKEDVESDSNQLRTTNSLVEVNVLPDLEGELKSEHDRTKSAGIIRIFHIFLDCCSLS